VSRSQRLSFLAIAAVIAVAAVIVLSASGGDDEEPAGTSAQATATPSATETAAPDETATPEPTRTPRPQPPLITRGKVTKLRFDQGETIRFRVRSDVADHVHVHGYDLFKDVEPGKTVSFSFPAEITGIFEIELEDRAEEIAQLRVDP
jgi:pyruvate/2-oxoglutarate dehydrogenase complex dihydrolipoamide acyltransferase (E2) component